MEFVYVVKRYDLFDLHFPHGFHHLPEDELRTGYLDRIAKHGFFVERRHCEQDSSLKQVIPYALISHLDRIFLLRRFSSQGESRLHNKLSIGVGGHINPVDDDADDILASACRREINEELSIEEPYEASPVGIINDESDPVGSVHFGIVHHVVLGQGRVAVRERDNMEGALVPIREIAQKALDPNSNLESWSSLIIEGIDCFFEER